MALLGTPIALLACIALYWKARLVRNWLVLGMAGWIAMMVVTVLFNVPLNQILDGLTITPDQANFADLWASYSVDWQKWNWLRVLTSGISLVAIALAIRNTQVRY
ncbi:anthrone oxygenase family protein [uncultured Roseobacter sp.]|uniref:anthrone oxygenase family protein n=1 Tax=uncultured Roseobacter sp. TaxID=114847 RepID=UPI002607C59B|nr:anthrone oxygenase family protein [uncultured Roseobacter sp.]